MKDDNIYLITMSSGGTYTFIIECTNMVVALEKFMMYLNNTGVSSIDAIDSITIVLLRTASGSIVQI